MEKIETAGDLMARGKKDLILCLENENLSWQDSKPRSIPARTIVEADENGIYYDGSCATFSQHPLTLKQTTRFAPVPEYVKVVNQDASQAVFCAGKNGDVFKVEKVHERTAEMLSTVLITSTSGWKVTKKDKVYWYNKHPISYECFEKATAAAYYGIEVGKSYKVTEPKLGYRGSWGSQAHQVGVTTVTQVDDDRIFTSWCSCCWYSPEWFTPAETKVNLPFLYSSPPLPPMPPVAPSPVMPPMPVAPPPVMPPVAVAARALRDMEPFFAEPNNKMAQKKIPKGAVVTVYKAGVDYYATNGYVWRVGYNGEVGLWSYDPLTTSREEFERIDSAEPKVVEKVVEKPVEVIERYVGKATNPLFLVDENKNQRNFGRGDLFVVERLSEKYQSKACGASEWRVHAHGNVYYYWRKSPFECGMEKVSTLETVEKVVEKVVEKPIEVVKYIEKPVVKEVIVEVPAKDLVKSVEDRVDSLEARRVALAEKRLAEEKEQAQQEKAEKLRLEQRADMSRNHHEQRADMLRREKFNNSHLVANTKWDQKSQKLDHEARLLASKRKHELDVLEASHKKLNTQLNAKVAMKNAFWQAAFSPLKKDGWGGHESSSAVKIAQACAFTVVGLTAAATTAFCYFQYLSHF